MRFFEMRNKELGEMRTPVPTEWDALVKKK
jgi:hypothetical protein